MRETKAVRLGLGWGVNRGRKSVKNVVIDNNKVSGGWSGFGFHGSE